MRFHPLAVSGLFVLFFGLGLWGASSEPSSGAMFYAGADISALPVYERAGVEYRAAGKPWDALQILRRVGVNVVRLRLFVNPTEGGVVVNDLAYTLKLAVRARDAGARLLLDIHYSDTWADPQHQITPAAWQKLGPDALAAMVASYTEDVLKAFAAAGVPPDYVQVGNEITQGMLWPTGRLHPLETADDGGWGRFLPLWRAGVEAVHRVAPSAKVWLHIESTGKLPVTRWYLDRVKASGVSIDAVGFSYYPEWHGTMEDLRATLTTASRDYPWPVLVLETAYPYKHDSHFDHVSNLEFPLTPAGQKAFLEGVVKAVRSVPQGRGLGVFYWQPEAVAMPSLDAWLAGSCSLFDDAGQVLPAAGFGLPAKPTSSPKPLEVSP